MISFRYLLVTIVSIFVALGLGVLAGTTVLDQGIVQKYKDRTSALEDHVRDLQADVSSMSAFLNLAVPHLVKGRLAHRDVVLIADDNADGGSLDAARTYLADAGADVVAELDVTNRLAAGNPASQGLLQILTQDGQTPSGDLTEATARALAARLEEAGRSAEPRGGTSRAGSHADLLADLLDGGYLNFPGGSPSELPNVGGPGQSVVVVAGGDGDPAVPFASFLVPFVEELVNDAVVSVAAAEPERTAHPFVGLLRDDSNILDQDRMVTVDDLDGTSPSGGVALVLGLKQLIRFHQGGEYGVKSGASGPIPKLP